MPIAPESRGLTWGEIQRRQHQLAAKSPPAVVPSPLPSPPSPVRPPPATGVSWDQARTLKRISAEQPQQQEPTGLAYAADVAKKTGQRFAANVVGAAVGIGSMAENAIETATAPVAKAVGKVSPYAEDVYKEYWKEAHATQARAIGRVNRVRAALPYSKAVQEAEEKGTWATTPEWWVERVPEVAADLGIVIGSEMMLPGTGIAYASSKSAGEQRNSAYTRMREQGRSDEEARALANVEGVIAGTVSAVTERLALPHLIGKAVPKGLSNKIVQSATSRFAGRAAKTTAGRIGKAAGAEGLQEVAEGIANESAQWLIENDDTAFNGGLQRRLQEFSLGAVGGAGARAGVEVAPRVRDAVDQIRQISKTKEGITKLRVLFSKGEFGRKSFEKTGLGKDLRLNAADRQAVIQKLSPTSNDVLSLAKESRRDQGKTESRIKEEPTQAAPEGQTTPEASQILPTEPEAAPQIAPEEQPVRQRVSKRKGRVSLGPKPEVSQTELANLANKYRESMNAADKQKIGKSLQEKSQRFARESLNPLNPTEVVGGTPPGAITAANRLIAGENIPDIVDGLVGADITYEDSVEALRVATDRLAKQGFVARLLENPDQLTRPESTPQQREIATAQRELRTSADVATAQIELLNQLSEQLPHRQLTEDEAKAIVDDSIAPTSSKKFDDLIKTAERFTRPQKGIKEAAVRGLKKFFTAPGTEYEPIYRTRKLSLATVKQEEIQVNMRARDLKKALKAEKDSPDLIGKVEAAIDFRGRGKFDPVDALPEGLRNPVRAMRNHSDRLMNALVDTGAALATFKDGDIKTKLPTPELLDELRTAVRLRSTEKIEAIKNRLAAAKHPIRNINLMIKMLKEEGQYRRRTFRAFSDPRWAKDVPARFKQEAENKFIKDITDEIDKLSKLFDKAKRSRMLLKQISKDIEDFSQYLVNRDTPGMRIMEERLAEARKKHEDILTEKRKLSGKFRAYSEQSGKKIDGPLTKKKLKKTTLTPNDLQNIAHHKVEEILSWSQNIAKSAATQKTGRIETQRKLILEKRGDSSEEVRQLLGQTSDPISRYAGTINKQARILASHEFIGTIKTLGMDNPVSKFLWKKNDPGRPAEASHKIAAESTDSLAPLNGMYTYPELIDSFRSSEKTITDGVDSYFGIRPLGILEGAVRSGLTVWNAATHFRQIVGNFALMSVSGNVNVLDPTKFSKQYRKAAEASASAAWGGGSPQARRDYIDAVGHGVAGENIDLGDIRYLRGPGDQTPINAAVRKVFKTTAVQTALPESLIKLAKKAGTTYEAVASIPEILYQAEDDIPRMATWYSEIDRLRRINVKRPKDQRIRRDAIKRDASITTRKIFQTYSEAGLLTRWARKIALGPFVSFPIEVRRTQANILMKTLSELKDPASKSAGAKRFGAWLATTTAAAGAGAKVTNAVLGMLGIGGFKDEEEEALREHVAPYHKYGEWIKLDDDADGNKQFIDLDSTNPLSSLTSPLKVLRTEGLSKDSALNTLREFFEPATAEPIVTGAIIDALRNKKKSSGGKVYNPMDTALGRTADIAAHVAKAATPGWMKLLQRFDKGLKGEMREGGKVYDPFDEMAAGVGVRVTKLSVPEAVKWETRRYIYDLIWATQLWTKVANRSGDVSADELRKARFNSERARQQIFDAMYKKFTSAQKLGMTKQQIVDIMGDEELGKIYIQELVDGRRSQREAATLQEITKFLSLTTDKTPTAYKRELRRRKKELIGQKMIQATGPGLTRSSAAARARAIEELQVAKISKKERSSALIYRWAAGVEPGLPIWSEAKKLRLKQIGVGPRQATKIMRDIISGPDAPEQFQMQGVELAKWMINRWASTGSIQIGRALTPGKRRQLMGAGISKRQAIDLIDRALRGAEKRKIKASLEAKRKIERRNTKGGS